MTDYDQMLNILPEQLMYDDEHYYAALAQGELITLQSYEHHADQKLLYILLDVSRSMTQSMQNGSSRHVWARGVTMNLLLKATQGEAKYFLRPFDGKPHSMEFATTPQETDRLIDLIYNMAFSGGGTNIYAAFSQAVDDIKTKGGEISQAEILLITDGDDKSMDDIAAVQNLMGEDIRLHAILIGRESESLKQVSHSYRIMW
jgi:uncharacterized protein with von Willebrand factor type A (vWA) domain